VNTILSADPVNSPVYSLNTDTSCKGRPILILWESGNSSEDEFGSQIFNQGTTQNVYRYTGQQSDADSSMYYLRARYYEPSTGRFITQDSYKGDPKVPSTLNLYVYCKNNPLKYTDPSGNDVIINDRAGQWADFSRQLTELTGYTFSLDNGHLKFGCPVIRANCYSSKSGAAVRLIYQMITSKTTISLDLTTGFSGVAGSFSEKAPQSHLIDVGDIQYELGIYRPLALGNLAHELAEAYAMATGSPHHSAHLEGIKCENLVQGELGSPLVRSGKDGGLQDSKGHDYGFIINYGIIRCRYLFGNPQKGVYPPASVEFIP